MTIRYVMEEIEMDTEKKVVAVLPLQHLYNPTKKVYATRIRALGVTAYGNSKEDSTKKANQMFAAFVALHRKYGTLQETLDQSKMNWCWENDYTGDVILMSPTGEEQVLHCKKQRTAPAWQDMGELVLA
jgi:hypothetical protein